MNKKTTQKISFMFIMTIFIPIMILSTVAIGTKNDSSMIILLILSFVIPFVITYSLLIRYLNKSFVKPLKELSIATKEVQNNQYDYDFKKTNNTEMDAYFDAFTLMQKSLKEAQIREEKYQNQRMEMITSIAHDLKTPMTAIKGYVEALQDNIASDPQTKDRYLKTIVEKTNYLTYLVNDLYTYAGLETGQFTFNFEKTKAEVIINKIIDTYKLENANVKYEFNNLSSSNNEIIVDHYRIMQIVENIIDNAKKHLSENGKITFNFFDENGMFVTEITDNGSGFKYDNLENIFEPFYKEDDARSSVNQGLGLGLSICKKIIIAHDGNIKSKKEINGATITFRIPIVQD